MQNRIRCRLGFQSRPACQFGPSRVGGARIAHRPVTADWEQSVPVPEWFNEFFVMLPSQVVPLRWQPVHIPAPLPVLPL